MFTSPRWLLLAAVLLSPVLSACDGPCQDLAEKICDCEPNQTRTRSCLITVDTAIQDPIQEDNDRCEVLLRSCTCDAIDRGDFEACGLTLQGSDS